jgi:alpha-ketoglutarate-dependent taurine dioxygenase
VIRTNPVTGWKSIFAVGHHVQAINGLSDGESKHALEWFKTLIVENHDLQVRHKWKNANDLGKFLFFTFLKPFLSNEFRTTTDNVGTAIWDNRSVYHTATYDYAGLGSRLGQRAVSLGEKPYYDPQSKSRREDLGLFDQ